tara:strand:+ start:155 stop:997 length:843 start_codon:yes stop_codon:yes gene_type:complete
MSQVTSAVIVEPRNHKALDVVIGNVFNSLPNVPIYLHHGIYNEQLAYAIKKKYPSVVPVNTGNADLNKQEYSKILTQKEFYEKLPDGQTLVFQTDSGFCNPALAREQLESYKNYDYVGAPWHWWGNKEAVGGNGGFSLRNPRTMEHLISNKINLKNSVTHHKPKPIYHFPNPEDDFPNPEDYWLSALCEADKTCRLPPLEVAGKFASGSGSIRFSTDLTDSHTVSPDPAKKIYCADFGTPIGIHYPSNICSKVFDCDPVLTLPTGNFTSSELEEKIRSLR